MLKIINRNGTEEPLNFSEVSKKTRMATEGIENVNQIELDEAILKSLHNGITTEEIQQIAVKTAVEKIDIDRPNWTFVAARLFLFDLYHKVGKKLKTKKGSAYGNLRTYLEYGEKEGRIMSGLKDKYDLDDLNSYIKPERDFQFNYLGIKTFFDRYLLKDRSGDPIELPQYLFMGVAMFLAQNEENRQEWAKKFYDLISNFEVMVATPTLSNARTPRHQLSSCYVGSTPDNIEGIFDAYKEMALLSKFGGGIGWEWSKVRAMGSEIDKHKGASGGIVPFLKIANDTAIAVDQLGTRKGAIAVYIEPWHLDVEDFLDLKKNSGEERRRAHDLFPALWINDLFMKRVENNENWTLFDPYEVKDLTDLYGDEFERAYIEYEKTEGLRKRVVSAKDLWKKMLREYFETGSPFLTFKDTANKRNPNNHSGMIRSSNLCSEIFENTSPSHYKVKISFENGETLLLEENEKILTSNGMKKVGKVTSIDYIDDKKVDFVEKIQIGGQTAVCNLASINLSRINTKEDIERVVPIAIRMLDNVIDLNFYPHKKTKKTNESNRAIGLGVMGEMQMLAEKGIEFGSDKHLQTIDMLMEAVSYNAIKASANIAKEKGVYPEFKGSKWDKGIFPIDTVNEEAKKLVNRDYEYDWKGLKEFVKENGMRNGYLMAIAPTSSISILTGTTQAIEPVFKRKWYEVNLSGQIPVTAPNLNPDTWLFYKSAYDFDQRDLVKAGAIRQKWIDQGQSLNIFMKLDKASGKYLNDIYMLAWKLGLKSTYYLRSQSPEAIQEENEYTEDRSIECVGCQ